jgi:hypothetical protein
MLKKISLLLTLFSSCFLAAHAQVCQGTLGAPIVNITFGNGPNNPGPTLPVAVPGAATTYTFQPFATGTPPANVILDGQYALVNQVPNNGAWFAGAPDNTIDQNGYMAFFNAAPAAGGEFYRQTVTGLCQGTTYQFQAFIANAVNPAMLPGGIAPNVTFQILDGNTLAVLQTLNTGAIPMQPNFTWVPYGMVFTVPPGTNTVILRLVNNSVGGNQQPGNDLAIDDISFSPCGPTTNASFDANTQQQMLTVCHGSDATLFGSVGPGLNNPTYQWQISSDAGVNWSDIAGATTLTYTMPALPTGNYQFRMLSAEAGNINFPNCRFISNTLFLDVIICPPVCADSCYWKVTGNNITGSNNIFGTLTNHDIRIFSNSVQRGKIQANGFFGWQINNPTTRLHVDGSNPGFPASSGLRFENLPFGKGFNLVVDGNGYVYRQGFVADEMQQELEAKFAALSEKNLSLQKEIAGLKAMIEPLVKAKSFQGESNHSSLSKLYQNKPNPFNGSTVVEYSLSGASSGGHIVVYDLAGKEMLRFPVKAGNGSITIRADQLVNGMYLYSLVVNGVEIETKKMILSQ